MPRTLFVTTALPYANGLFHIGHIMEYIQADIWVRFQRMQGHTVHFVGADDAHGAPIMLAAEKAGKAPEAFIAGIQRGRKPYLDGFHIGYDNWHSTHSLENTELSQDIYRRLKGAGLVYTKRIEQFYDPVKGMFLADRYIKGPAPIDLPGERPIRGRLRGLWHGLFGNRPDRPLLDPVRREAGAQVLEHYFFKLPIRSARASSDAGLIRPDGCSRRW